MTSLQGQLLIAAPALLDPNFFRSVILMVQHGEEGALGLILNRPTDTALREAWAEVSSTACERTETLHQGGPCEGVLMVLHAEEAVSEIQVLPDVHFTTEKDKVEWLVAHGQGAARFFVGYAGWGPGQLEKELAEGSWLTAPATREQVFSAPADQWSMLVKLIARAAAFVKVNPKIIPEDPSNN